MASRGIVSLIRRSTPKRLFRFYPPHYPPIADVAATMPYWIYPHLDESQLALVDKAKGDWKELTEDDRLRLYRAQFPVTFSEMNFPPSYGFQAIGGLLWVCSLVFPIYWLIKEFLLSPAPYQLHPDYMNMLQDRLDAVHQHPVWGPQGKYYDRGHLIPREEGGY